MAFNVLGSQQIPLATWNGLVTETPGINLPEGCSPDNQDVEYVPGEVVSRRGIARIFSTPMGTTTLTYAKTYTDNSGNVRNLYLDSAGNIWVQTPPSTYTLLGTTFPTSYAKSCTAFGREYIAISDGLNSTDVPLQFDGTNLDRVTQDGPGAPPTIANTIIAATTMVVAGGFSISRTGNVVTVNTATAHNLKVGYLAQISGVSALPINFADSIVIDNEDTPGIATVTMPSPHGLGSGEVITLINVAPVTGATISGMTRSGGVVTVGTTTDHGLSAGAVINISGSSDPSFNTTVTVAFVIDLENFTFLQTDTDGTSTGGAISTNWPNTGSSVQAQYEVLSVPTASSFQIAIEYSDGTWTNLGGGEAGAVFFPWSGTFFVASVPTATSFTYAQNGPNGSSTDLGTVTPTGQAAPGQHQLQVIFLTRQGYTTKPSPPVLFNANGGQYLSVTNIPLGPPNVVARILAFTGTDGALFFYIPVPAQVNGQIVSTATVVSDNTTTSVVLDFSDNTLFASLGISIPGNNLANQRVLDGAISFGFFGSRLITFGQRNNIQNLLNMGFDGGHFSGAPTIPTGWSVSGSAGGALATGHYGQGWQIGGSGFIFQGFYEDAYGAPIGTAQTQYTLRAWIAVIGGTLTVTISSATSGFSTSATITGLTAAGSFIQADFAAKMPTVIPIDMRISIQGSGGALVDEISIIYTANPYLNTVLFGSYVNNPEGFDNVSGKFGPSEDTHKVMGRAIIRNSLFLLTQDPGGRWHSVTNTGVTEPAGWSVDEVGSMCGALSIFGITESQEDDATGAGGEEFVAWAAYGGARIFGGDQPWKISQEIQPDWDRMNLQAAQRIWVLNDFKGRVLYFGLPMGVSTAPNLIYPMNYKSLDASYQIAQADPIKSGPGGRLFTVDGVRKWTRWNLTMNGATIMNVGPGSPAALVLLAGNGQAPGTGISFGNAYVVCAGKLYDDDYGQILPYYVTYFFTSEALEAALQLGAARHMLAYFQWASSGLGVMRVTALVNSLTNPWPLLVRRNLRTDPSFDDEWPGGNAVGQRIAFKFESLPVGSV